ncbi:GmrSD restriction endonuclease domain-containing protein [Marivita sp.]|uniref:GmrSD restriction endonuclease domain-containing protein n=1 Tax=Marivita sp. TaxID=2003365 RepID=UPI003A8A0FEC
MELTTFTTNPRSLEDLLKEAKNGKIQLPDFQRSWVWDEDRIIDLLASISRAFPIGAIMTLKTGGDVNFHPRPIQGVDEKTQYPPEELLLDGQQRLTSIYQVAMRGEVVETTTIKHKKIKRWFYIDIRAAIDPSIDKVDAIFSVPEDKKLKSSDRWPSGLNLQTQTDEFENLIFPICETFNWNNWQRDLITFLNENGTFGELWSDVIVPFEQQFISVFRGYDVPVISLGKSTSKEAVCTVFEKVNTGGKALDAFELVTAMYAAEGHKLRDDWYGDGKSKVGYAAQIAAFNSIGEKKEGVLSKVDNTDFLQVISLFHTRDLRLAAVGEGKQGKDLPQVTGKRAALLNLPLSAYLTYREKALLGFERAAKLLHMFSIFYVRDLPYQTQVIPLAAILADIGQSWESAAVREKLAQWYWCGVFGELYGSAVDTRIGSDFMEVPAWFEGGPMPKTVLEANFHRDRLLSMRMRLSAAYKGVNALLMKSGAKDFRSGQKFEHTSFFDEAVDIHHIFPQKWCLANGKGREFDSIINKTPLSARTNRIIGGDAPSKYLEKLEAGSSDAENVDPKELDRYLESHLIDPILLREDKYETFMSVRQQKLLDLIESAMKKQAGSDQDDEGSWGEQVA